MPDVAPLYVTVNADGTINTFQQSGFSSGRTLQGGIATSPPFDSTSGDPLTIKETGDYLLSLSGSCYSNIVGLQFLDLWFDGIFLFNSKLWFSETGEWHTFPTTIFLASGLTKGLHYIWIRTTGLQDPNGVATWSCIPA